MIENYSVSLDRLQSIVRSLPESTIIVIGDCMIDEYIWGDVERISPEAPVPVVAVESETRRLGGAANVVQNLAALGVNPFLISVCGDDDDGIALTKMLKETGSSTEWLIRSNKRPTSVKTRIIARHQQVVRVDRELIRDLDEEECAAALTSFDNLLGRSAAVIVSDYAKGVICAPLIKNVIERCSMRNIFIAVDPKERNMRLYRGVSVITPNLKEAHMLLGVPPRHCSNEEIESLGWRIIEAYDIPYLLITLSERGMALFCRQSAEATIMPTVAKKVFDVTGAGDTVISVFTAAITAGATPIEAAFLANHAAGITVSQIGTAFVDPDELLNACSDALSIDRGKVSAV